MSEGLAVVCGGGGFIGGHLTRALLRRGTRVRSVDVKPLEDWHQRFDEVENLRLDLREIGAAREAVAGARVVYNLASDMGGMGFIEHNKALCMLNVLINTHLLMAAREAGVERYFFASTACVYAASRQNQPNLAPLAEPDAYPADPEDGYGWEKLFGERMCRHFREDFGLETRVARIHAAYGPRGTFEGGREKAPAALARKVIEAKLAGKHRIEIWGDGEQTRSFMYVDDCVEGILRLTASDHAAPLNLGSSEKVSINQLVDVLDDIAGVTLERVHDLNAPLGVNGRSSDNRRIREALGWEPSTRLRDGLERTYAWILEQLLARRSSTDAGRERPQDGGLVVDRPNPRTYPVMARDLPRPVRPISFVCVRYSDEFWHNLNVSECVHDDLNELVVVDNRSNVFFSTLGQALNAGIARARHDLLVFVHEDVLLQPGWQSMLERSLTALERHDPDWGVIGVAGWNTGREPVGHWSDPHGYRDTLGGLPFSRAAMIDEQVVVLRKSRRVRPDPDLPGIHNLGRDLAWEARRRGSATYVVDAPSIHKHADASGRVVAGPEESEKIRNRRTLTWLHSKECSDEYFAWKWRLGGRGDGAKTDLPGLSETENRKLRSPIVLVGRGGSGTRLLSTMASDLGLFAGNKTNGAGDCLEMVGAIYRAIYRRYQCPSNVQKSSTTSDLRTSAAQMLAKADWPAQWGFKLPESLLVLDEIASAFPDARYVFLKRDPITTVLKRTHMTGRLDNEIGRALVPAAYDFAGVPRQEILSDDPALHMARATVHQYSIALDVASRLTENRWHEVRFEDLVDGASDALSELAKFCDRPVVSGAIVETVDRGRASQSIGEWPEHVVAAVTEILSPIRRLMEYA